LYQCPDADHYITFDNAPVWVTTRFVPIETNFNMFNNPLSIATGGIQFPAVANRATGAKWTEDGAAKMDHRNHFNVIIDQNLSVVQETFKVVDCHSTLHTFSIDRNIYLSLVQRYTENPLIFPIQTLAVWQTNGSFNQTTGELNFTTQHIPRFVDSIFFFFPFSRKYETCFMDPGLTDIQISMGDFGAYRFLSSDHPEFYENIQNVMNLNNDVVGMSKDLMRAYTATDKSGIGWKPNDDTNYVFGIPTSVDNTFQQGQTSQSIVAYTFEAHVASNSRFSNCASCVPEIAFLMDSVFAIQVVAGGGVVCRLKELDITTPAD
jgi:hypothetical protein